MEEKLGLDERRNGGLISQAHESLWKTSFYGIISTQTNYTCLKTHDV